MSKRTGAPEQRTRRSALRPRRQNSSRQNRAGWTRLPPGWSPKGAVPAVTTWSLADTDLMPLYQAFRSPR